MKFGRHVINYRLFKPVVVVLLRKCNIAFLLTAQQSISQSGCVNFPTMSTKSHFSTEANDGLLLYQYQFSFFSQKVVMALHEKKLPFESRTVNLLSNEQYEPWFLNLNPKGEVPVLQDTGKTIPDSGRIIDYLEDNFSNGDTPRLIPLDQGPEVRQSVIHFRQLIQGAPQALLTTGAICHPTLMRNPKIPFIGPVRRFLANSEKNSANKLRGYANRIVMGRDELLQKANNSERKYEEMLNESKFREVLDQVDKILNKVEDQLARHQQKNDQWWLCSDRFTIADIELAILLERISQLGLEYMFWSGGKRPNIDKYYERVKQRDSYKKTIPGTLFLLKTIIVSQTPFVIGVVAAFALVIGGVYYAKKYIS